MVTKAVSSQTISKSAPHPHLYAWPSEHEGNREFIYIAGECKRITNQE